MTAVEVTRIPLETKEFDGLRKIIREVAGITLSDQKRELVAGRLQSRLRALGFTSFAEYLPYVTAEKAGEEGRELINCITTNKTSFFREPHHFAFMRERVIPDLLERVRGGAPRKIRIWSAGCSMGHEPWTIAMTLAESIGSLAGWDIRILASDLDTNVLATAEEAIYDEIALADVPAPLRAKYFQASRSGDGFYRVAAQLRSLVTFRRINLTAPASWSIRTQFDMVFCRNVAIYFDRPTQATVFTSLANQLTPHGYLVSGHSENLHWLSDVITPVGNTIHVRTGTVPSAPKSGVRPSARPRAPEAPPRATLATRTAQRPAAPRAHLQLPATTSSPSGREIAIQAGGVHASAEGITIRTLLGSCVAVCLYDPAVRIGGMNHFLLPADTGGGDRAPSTFGVHSMELLINGLMKLGADRRRLVAKVFGGGSVIGGLTTAIGQRNVAFAREFLSDEGIQVVAQKVGATSALSVLFDTGTGTARVKELAAEPDVVRDERRCLQDLARPRSVDQDITFFGTP